MPWWGWLLVAVLGAGCAVLGAILVWWLVQLSRMVDVL